MTTMQESVQAGVLASVAVGRETFTSQLLAQCPGSDARDVRAAVRHLCDDGAIAGSPFVLTDEGRRRVTSAA